MFILIFVAAQRSFTDWRKGRFWRVDLAQSSEDNWRDITSRGFKGWSIQSSPQTRDDLLVIASSDRNLALSDLHTNRLDGSYKHFSLKTRGKRLDGCWARI